MTKKLTIHIDGKPADKIFEHAGISVFNTVHTRSGSTNYFVQNGVVLFTLEVSSDDSHCLDFYPEENL